MIDAMYMGHSLRYARAPNRSVVKLENIWEKNVFFINAVNFALYLDMYSNQR
jgi:hypothetical protein